MSEPTTSQEGPERYLGISIPEDKAHKEEQKDELLELAEHAGEAEVDETIDRLRQNDGLGIETPIYKATKDKSN